MTTDERPLVAFGKALEADLTAKLGMAPIVLPERFALAQGAWRGAAVRIETRAYRGARMKYARFVSITGGALEIVNVLAIPAFEIPAPVFGADLVSIRAESALLVCDLVPTLREGSVAESQRELSRRAASTCTSFPDASELPPWAARWFSPHPFVARVTREDLANKLDCVRSRAEAFAARVTAIEPHHETRDAVRDAVCGYCAAHRVEDRSLELIARMFGEAWSDAYMTTILFPDFEVRNGCV